MFSRKRIGILAGMGPRSTTPFLELVYDECQKQYGAKYDIDFPEIVIFSWPTPFYIDREVNDELLFQAITNGLIELEKNHIDITAIPCNIAHKYFDRLRENAKSKLLNIIDITAAGISAESRRVTVLATEATMKTGIYQNGITEKGKELVFKEKWQGKVNGIIKLIKGKEEYGVVRRQYRELEGELEKEGIDTIVLACTDLAVIKEEDQGRVRIIDSSKELAKKLIEEYLK